MKKTFLAVISILVLSLTTLTQAAFLDDFENPGLVAYTYQDSYGSGGSYSITGGTLNITVASDNTATVITTDTVNFAVGDTLRLDVPPVSGNRGAFLVCSTAASQPNGTSIFGFRFRRDGGGMYARMNLYPGGVAENTLDPAPDKPATLNVQRVSDAGFVYSITIQGLQTPLGSFTLPQLAGIYTLHIGAQAFDLPGSTSSFDNLSMQPQTIHNITQDLWYNSIQSSIDNANSMDHIEAAPGIYREAINFNGKAVHLYSSGGPDVTTINGYGAFHVVQCASGEGPDTILEGFTISGGNAGGTYPDDRGSGMWILAGSPTVTHCIFAGNSASYGGGMYNFVGTSPMVTLCIFTGNTATDGGGMYNDNSSPAVTNCTFSGNTVSSHGGGMFNFHSGPAVTNCTLTDNSANYGGGIFNYISSPAVTNCTFSGNTTYYTGSGMCNDSSSPTVTNCILWNNNANEIWNLESTPAVTYCDVQGGYTGLGNINAGPNFLNAAAGDFRLAANSPCIDAGSNAAIPAGIFKDVAGKLRFADDPLTTDTGNAATTGRPVVDIGAHEYQGLATIPQNLLANPGFEAGDARGWITNWGFALAADTAQVYDGTYSGLVSNRSASWQGAWQSVQGLMDDGKTYRISGWVRLENVDSNDISLTVKTTDSSGTHYYWIDTATAYDDQWVHLDGTLALTIVGQSTEIFVYFEGPAAGVNFYVDDASVTEVKGDISHNGRVDLTDFGLLASYYGLDCSAQDCGRANLDDSDNTINTLDLAVLADEWLLGA